MTYVSYVWEAFLITILIESTLPLYYLLMRILSKKAINIKKRYWYPKVSIIVPTFNEESTILQKLINLSKLNYPSDKIEVFVVDGASTDNTIELAAEFKIKNPELNITLINEKIRNGKAFSINKTVPLCNGELICITDSDCSWDINALREVVADLFDKQVGAVTGTERLIDKNVLSEKLEDEYNDFYNTLRIGESVLDSTPIIRGPLMIFRADLLKQIEVGTESPTADDCEIAVKIRKLGYKVIAEKNAIIHVFAPPTFNSSKNLKSRRGIGLINLFIKNLSVIFNPMKFGRYSFICGMNLFSLTLSPILIFLNLIFFIIILSSLSFYLNIAILIIAMLIFLLQYILFKNKLGKTIYSFILIQFTLLSSIPFIFSKDTKWNQITEVRNKWKSRY